MTGSLHTAGDTSAAAAPAHAPQGPAEGPGAGTSGLDEDGSRSAGGDATGAGLAIIAMPEIGAEVHLRQGSAHVVAATPVARKLLIQAVTSQLRVL